MLFLRTSETYLSDVQSVGEHDARQRVVGLAGVVVRPEVVPAGAVAAEGPGEVVASLGARGEDLAFVHVHASAETKDTGLLRRSSTADWRGGPFIDGGVRRGWEWCSFVGISLVHGSQ